MAFSSSSSSFLGRYEIHGRIGFVRALFGEMPAPSNTTRSTGHGAVTVPTPFRASYTLSSILDLVTGSMLRRVASASSRASRFRGLSKTRKDGWAPLFASSRRWSDMNTAGFVSQPRTRAFTTDIEHHSLLTNHPKRHEVASVLHARPWQRIACPSLISSITTTQKYPVLVDGVSCPMASMVDPKLSYENDYNHLKALCEHFIVTPPPHGTTFFTHALGPLFVRWERHTEVCSYTFTMELPKDMTQQNTELLKLPFDEKNVVVAVLPKPWLKSFPGGVVSATHVVLKQGDDKERWSTYSSEIGNSDASASGKETTSASTLLTRVKPLFNHSELITGSEIDRGRFRVYSDWRVHGDGFGRIVMDHNPNDARAFVSSAAGKAAQRMIELDKYRMLSLMGLPFAQALSKTVDTLNEEVMQVMDAIGTAEREGMVLEGDTGDERGHKTQIKNRAINQRLLLSRLTALAATAQKLSAVAHDRFAASAAYAELVNDRVGFLAMDKINAVPGMASFLSSAIRPGSRTCLAVQKRLDKLANSAHLTANIMQTSLTVEQHAQSNENLNQLKATSMTQLTMQHNVEGLSTVALTYYSIGVLGYLTKAAAGTVGLPVSPEVALGASIPLVWVAVSAAVRRMKQAAMAEGGGH